MCELRQLTAGSAGLQKRQKIGQRHPHGRQLLLECGILGKIERIQPCQFLFADAQHSRHRRRIQLLSGYGKADQAFRLCELRQLTAGSIGLQKRQKIGQRHPHGRQLLLECGILGKIERIEPHNGVSVHAKGLRHLFGRETLLGRGKLNEPVQRPHLRLGRFVKVGAEHGILHQMVAQEG